MGECRLKELAAMTGLEIFIHTVASMDANSRGDR